MPYQVGLPRALKRFGLQVEVVPGWESAGSPSFRPGGSIGHHTAGPKTGDRPSLRVCVEGRPGLPGPLCNTFLPRGLTPAQQKVVVVAAGRANHAGKGGFRGLRGNSSVFGTEMEDDGLDSLWTPWQLWAMPRAQAAQLWLAGADQTYYASHRTWAPARKIDPTGIADHWMRQQIHALLTSPMTPPPRPTPRKGTRMMTICNDGSTVWLLSDTKTRRRLGSPAAVRELVERGAAVDIGRASDDLLGQFAPA